MEGRIGNLEAFTRPPWLPQARLLKSTEHQARFHIPIAYIHESAHTDIAILRLRTYPMYLPGGEWSGRK